MQTDKKQESKQELPEVVIPKEKAVFWMDDRGQWCNRHGRFAHNRIIAHFNRSIRKDDNGYFVTQVRAGIREKVYFRFEKTPLFAVRVTESNPMGLVLNTGKTVALAPSELFVESDDLYQNENDACIKFTDRALLALAPYLEEDEKKGLCLHVDDQRWLIPEKKSSTRNMQ